MAGDWIKMRDDLPSDPAVYKLAAITKLDRFAVIGRLYAFWAWADKHAVDGRVDGASSLAIDDITQCEGFAEALRAVKWLETGEDFIALPKHDRHNGESAKERGLKNARQARWREGKTSTVDAQPSTKASTREEKRREEKSTKDSGANGSHPTAEKFISELSANPTYEGIDVKREFGKMSAWCKEHRKQPTRKRFVNWLNRADLPLLAKPRKNGPNI